MKAALFGQCLVVLVAACVGPSGQRRGAHPHGSRYAGASEWVEAVVSSDGNPSLVIECEYQLQCLQRAIEACPYGYDILGTDSHWSVNPERQADAPFARYLHAMLRCTDRDIYPAIVDSDYVFDSMDVNNCIEAEVRDALVGIDVTSLELRCHRESRYAHSARPTTFLGLEINSKKSFLHGCKQRHFEPATDGDVLFCPGLGWDLEADAKTFVAFCGPTMCAGEGLVKTSAVERNAVEDYRKLTRLLTQYFGQPAIRSESFLTICNNIATFRSCLGEDGHAYSIWRWEDGRRYLLELLPGGGSNSPYVAHFRYDLGEPLRSELPAPKTQPPDSPPPASPARVCIPGQSFACNGPGKCDGYQVCDDDGRRLGPCQCD